MKFRFSIGGYFSGRFEVRLKDHVLLFFFSHIPSPIDLDKPDYKVSVVGDSDFDNLVSLLKSLKWKRNYDSTILDGTQWELEFESEAVKIKCYGSNAYPSEFGTLLDALKVLTSKYGITDNLLDMDSLE